MPDASWRSTARLILMKTLGVVLCVLFLLMGLALLSFPMVALLTNQGGVDGKVVAVSDRTHGCHTGTRVGGLFTLSVTNSSEEPSPKKKPQVHPNVYGVYPAWPDHLEPTAGDEVRIWPGKKPLLAMPAIEGWGWILLGTVLVVGLIFLEFSLLSLTLH
ncbi:MAG TPA: hypothetical protein VHE12_13075 [bacterium]|nr:hypothetical protein [bacterium]